MATEHILHMHKSLRPMNVQIHHVLIDMTGLSGLALLDAILAGERELRETRAVLPYFCEEPTRQHCANIAG